MFGHYQSTRGGHGWGLGYGRHGHHRGEFFRRPKYNLPINIADNDTNFEVYVYALGYAKENIKISVQEDVLYITGTRAIDEEKAPNFSKQEYPIKSFERMLNLNGKVDVAGITAKQEEGVLIVTLPKNAEAQRPSQDIPVL